MNKFYVGQGPAVYFSISILAAVKDLFPHLVNVLSKLCLDICNFVFKY